MIAGRGAFRRPSPRRNAHRRAQPAVSGVRRIGRRRTRARVHDHGSRRGVRPRDPGVRRPRRVPFLLRRLRFYGARGGKNPLPHITKRRGQMTEVAEGRQQNEGARDRAASTVQEAASATQDKAVELRSKGADQLRQQLDTRTTDAGRQAQSVAQAIRKSGENLRTEGTGTPRPRASRTPPPTASSSSAGTSSRRSGDELLRDAEQFARRRPWLIAGIGLFAGLVASRVMKASSERRYESSSPSYEPRSVRELGQAQRGSLMSTADRSFGRRDEPLGEVARDLTRDLSLLVRQEVELAKAEMAQKGRVAAPGFGMIGGATLAGHRRRRRADRRRDPRPLDLSPRVAIGLIVGQSGVPFSPSEARSASPRPENRSPNKPSRP